MMRVRIAAVAAAVLVFSVACGDDENPTPTAPTVVTPSPPVVTQPAVVTPQNLTIQGPTWFADSNELEVDQTAQLRANLELSDGSTREDVDAEWTSSNTTVATVSADGLLTGRQPGGFDLRATAEGLTARVSGIRVVPKPVPWRASGTGATILDLPTRITRIRIEGEYTGSSENFIIWCGIGGDRGGLLVNEILGTRSSTHYSGIHSARRSYGNAGDPCRELQVEHSQGIRWTITETSPRSALSPAASTGSAFGDEEAVRRAREQRNQF
jgi:hypothetical protein